MLETFLYLNIIGIGIYILSTYRYNPIDPMIMNHIKTIYLVSSFLLFGMLVNSQNLIVPTDYGNIQSAINAADDLDTITVLPGIYSGNGNIEIDLLGKKIYLRSKDGPENTIIDCQQLGRGFYLHLYEDSTTVIDGFKIINAESGGFDEYGGGMRIFWSSPLIINCIIDNCHSQKGGAFIIQNSHAILRNCIISNNRAHDFAGIWLQYANVLIENTIFDSNIGECQSAISINSYGTATIRNCRFFNNETSPNCGSTVDVFYESSLHMINCEITSNKGDALSVRNGSHVTVINCLIANNDGSGVNVSNPEGSIDFQNTNILYNSEEGMIVGMTELNMRNCIIYGNELDEIYLWSSYHTPVISYSLIEDRTLGGIVGIIDWQGENYDEDPIFRDVSQNKYFLGKQSPCINSGAPEMDSLASEFDLLGNPRIVGGQIDIGCYEHTIIHVTDTTEICEGDSIFYHDQWIKDNKLIYDTSISVEGYDSITAAHFVIIDCSASINDLYQPLLNVYPNPFNDIVYVKFNKQADYNIVLIDILGRKIEDLYLKQTNETYLNLRDIPKGTYILIVNQGKQYSTYKIVKSN